MDDWQIFTWAAWVLCILALGPRMGWDAFEEREKQPDGFLYAALVPAIPFAVIALLVALSPLIVVDKIARIWKADWS